MDTTGKRIKNARKAAGLTQTELAEKVGVKCAAIHKYENGLVVNLKRDTIDNLAKALNVKPSYLLCIDEEQPTTTKDDELLTALKSNPTKLMLAEWICRLNEEQLQMVEGILQAVIGKSDK